VQNKLCGFLPTHKKVLESDVVYGTAKLQVDGEAISSKPVDSAIQVTQQIATGLLHDCSKLTLITKSTCAKAKGKICVIIYSYEDVLPWQVSNQAKKSGCAGVIAFSTMETESVTSQFDDELLIPYVHVGKEEGLSILNGKIETTSSIQVDICGAACYPSWESNRCSSCWLCAGANFCELNNAPELNVVRKSNEYSEGHCSQCPSGDNIDPINCLFQLG
jgi:hypothetical protein